MTTFQLVVLLATLLSSLVAGFLFAFAVVIMPGFRSLENGAFIRAFQVIDRVIQNNQPLFLLVWIGSALSLVAAAVMGFWQLNRADRALLITAAVVSVLGVHVPTVGINLPLNNQLQRLDVSTMNESTRQRAREDFEIPWNRWNVVRTVCASLVVVMLLVLLLRL
jgi:uncharacterized membrane protein